MYTGAILILSGPSGSGKSSLCKELFACVPECHFSVSTTTRAMRHGEADGKDYFFVDKSRFEAGIAAGDFLEWAEVHGNYYGTSRKAVMDALQLGQLVVFDIDVQGHDSLRSKFPGHATSVFITTPTREALRTRLSGRGSEEQALMERRVAHAEHEMVRLGSYDYLIINDDLQTAARELIAVATCARLRTTLVNAQAFVTGWMGQGV